MTQILGQVNENEKIPKEKIRKRKCFFEVPIAYRTR